MRKIMVTVVAPLFGAMLAVTPASAQTAPEGDAVMAWPASALHGTPVLSREGTQVGVIVDLLIDREGAAHAQIDVSGRLGAPGRAISAPVKELRFTQRESSGSGGPTFAPTDRTGGALVSGATPHRDAPPAASSVTTRQAVNRTLDEGVPASVEAAPATGRAPDPRGAQAFADVRARAGSPRYFTTSNRRMGLWSSPESAVLDLTTEDVRRLSGAP